NASGSSISALSAATRERSQSGGQSTPEGYHRSGVLSMDNEALIHFSTRPFLHLPDTSPRSYAESCPFGTRADRPSKEAMLTQKTTGKSSGSDDEKPKIVDYGTLAELTAGTKNGNFLDATFPVHPPKQNLTFSVN